jgi:GrpB-like predicted nucleotidyltransferase (UPF0157 family)
MVGDDAKDAFSITVRGSDTDAGSMFEYRWLDNRQFHLIDPEMSQFLNGYNIPELFIPSDSFGLERGKLHFARAHDEWIRIYEYEELEVRKAALNRFEINHIGSTAVKGLCAKPIIDVLIGLHRESDRPLLIETLSSIGYTFKGEYGISGRSYFTKGNASITLFHVHAFLIADEKYQNHLRLIDNLRKNKVLRDKYEMFKIESRWKNREEYSNSKALLISEIIAG